MRPTIKDLDFSFEEQFRQREDDRRRQVETPIFRKPVNPGWKVTDGQPPQPRWTVTRETGKPAQFVENWSDQKSTQFARQGAKSESLFVMRILDACCVAAEHAAPGDIVKCYPDTAASLWERAEVLEEIRTA